MMWFLQMPIFFLRTVIEGFRDCQKLRPVTRRQSNDTGLLRKKKTTTRRASETVSSRNHLRIKFQTRHKFLYLTEQANYNQLQPPNKVTEVIKSVYRLLRRKVSNVQWKRASISFAPYERILGDSMWHRKCIFDKSFAPKINLGHIAQHMCR